MRKIFVVLALSLFGIMTVAQATVNTVDDESVKRGEYAAHAANCVACHSFDKGPYAGGTPFGIANSPNITPDKETGIGNYSLEDFDKALRLGISKKGFSLSVMMPLLTPWLAKLTLAIYMPFSCTVLNL